MTTTETTRALSLHAFRYAERHDVSDAILARRLNGPSVAAAFVGIARPSGSPFRDLDPCAAEPLARIAGRCGALVTVRFRYGAMVAGVRLSLN